MGARVFLLDTDRGRSTFWRWAVVQCAAHGGDAKTYGR
jgi:hypothetical protein